MAAGAASEVAVGDPLRPVSRGLIAAKLQRPWTRQGLVQRAALLARLEGAEQPILGLVAPAGYGKTTVLGQMADRTPFATAWLSLDSFDNDPNILFRYLVAALAQIDPVGAVDWADAVDEAGVQPGSALRRMAMIVSSIQVPFLLTLDHAEAVTNPSAGDLIAAVALNLPPGGRLAVGSRTALPLGDARLRVEGQLAIVGPDELAMGIDEADALVQAAGVDLSDDEVRAVVARTEGWAVGIYLAGLSMAQDAPEAGSSRPIPRRQRSGDRRLSPSRGDRDAAGIDDVLPRPHVGAGTAQRAAVRRRARRQGLARSARLARTVEPAARAAGIASAAGTGATTCSARCCRRSCSEPSRSWSGRCTIAPRRGSRSTARRSSPSTTPWPPAMPTGSRDWSPPSPPPCTGRGGRRPSSGGSPGSRSAATCSATPRSRSPRASPRR